MRQGESMGLRWGDVDMERGRIVLHDTKNNERRAVPLTGHALDVIREHARVRRLDSDLLFPGRKPDRPVNLRKPWEAALSSAGITGYRWHDNRHGAASEMIMSGASLAEVAEVLGHKTLSMVRRYSHLSEQHAAGVVERMNRRIFEDEK